MAEEEPGQPVAGVDGETDLDAAVAVDAVLVTLGRATMPWTKARS